MHSGQVRFTEKPPWPRLTVPRPSHTGQVSMLAPGAAPEPSHVAHSSRMGTFTVTLPPRTAVRNGTVTSYSTFRPRSGPRLPDRCLRRRPRSKRELKISPRPPSPMSPRSPRSVWNREPPFPDPAPPPRAPEKAPIPPYLRIRSYFLRRSGSERTR